MADDTRIEDLRRRIREDPASIAFAQLAEELRRAGRLEEAVAVCHTGLKSYPAYISARVTLGRAHIALDQLDEAERELGPVGSAAPENLAATRALAELRARRRGSSAQEAESAPVPAPSPASTTTVERKSTVDAFEYIRIVRTLAALESWLAAIHASRAKRRA
jgi:tetratricopeptide (TPR) repeat protein